MAIVVSYTVLPERQLVSLRLLSTWISQNFLFLSIILTSTFVTADNIILYSWAVSRL